MATPKLSRLELRIMDVLWSRGGSSIREIQEAFPERGRPHFSTVQTTISRLEAKGAVERTKKIGNAQIFSPLVSREQAQSRLIDELLAALGGGARHLMAHLIEYGKLSIEDVREARKAVRKLSKRDKAP